MDGENEVGGISVVEMTNEAQQLSASEMNAVFSVLSFIDQFTGGAIAQEPSASRIIIRESTEGMSQIASANHAYIELAIDRVREEAIKENVPVEDAIRIILIHEILGHQTERYLDPQNRTGEYYKNYFDYSTEKTKDEYHVEVHDSILPKNDDFALDTNPVRPYGYVNSAEDLATTSELFARYIAGLKEFQSAKSKLRHDEHREEIFMDFLNDVAQKAQAEYQEQWGVGSPVKYIEGPSRELSVAPRRGLTEPTETTPQSYIKSQLEQVLSISRDKRQFVIGTLAAG